MQLAHANRNFVTAFLVEHEALIKQELTEKYPEFVQSLESHLVRVVSFQETQSEQILQVLQRKDDQIQQLEASLQQQQQPQQCAHLPSKQPTDRGVKEASTQVTFEKQIVDQLKEQIHQQALQIDVLLDEIQQLRAQLVACAKERSTTERDSNSSPDESIEQRTNLPPSRSVGVQTQDTMTTEAQQVRQVASIDQGPNPLDTNEIESLEQQIAQIECQSAQLERFLAQAPPATHADELRFHDEAEKWLVNTIQMMEFSSECNMFGVVLSEDGSGVDQAVAGGELGSCLDLYHQLHAQTLQIDLVQEDFLNFRRQMTQEISIHDVGALGMKTLQVNDDRQVATGNCAEMLKRILRLLKRIKPGRCRCAESAKQRASQWNHLTQLITGGSCRCSESPPKQQEHTTRTKRITKLIQEWAGWEQAHLQEMHQIKQQHNARIASLKAQSDAMRCELHQLYLQLGQQKADNKLLKRQLDDVLKQRHFDALTAASDSLPRDQLPDIAQLLLRLEVLEKSLRLKTDQLHASDTVIQALTADQLGPFLNQEEEEEDHKADQPPLKAVASGNVKKTVCELLKQLEMAREEQIASEKRAEQTLLDVSRHFELECELSKLQSDLANAKHTTSWLQQQNDQLLEELHQANSRLAKMERLQSRMRSESTTSPRSLIWNSYDSCEALRQAGKQFILYMNTPGARRLTASHEIGMICTLQLEASERHRTSLQNELRSVRSFLAISTQMRSQKPPEPMKRVQEALNKIAACCQCLSNKADHAVTARTPPLTTPSATTANTSKEMAAMWKANYETLTKQHDMLWTAFDHLHRLVQVAFQRASGFSQEEAVCSEWNCLDSTSADSLVALVRASDSGSPPQQDKIMVFRLSQQLEHAMEMNRVLEQRLAEKAIDFAPNQKPWTIAEPAIDAIGLPPREARSSQTDCCMMNQESRSTQTTHSRIERLALQRNRTSTSTNTNTRNRRVQVDLHKAHHEQPAAAKIVDAQVPSDKSQPLQVSLHHSKTNSTGMTDQQAQPQEHEQRKAKPSELLKCVQRLTKANAKLQQTIESHEATIGSLQSALQSQELTARQLDQVHRTLQERDKALEQATSRLESREQENLQLKQQLMTSESDRIQCQQRFDQDMKLYVDQINAKLSDIEQTKSQVCQENDALRQELANAAQWLQHKEQNSQSTSTQTHMTMQMALEERASQEKALAQANTRLVDLQKLQKHTEQALADQKRDFQQLKQQYAQLQQQFVEFQQAARGTKEESDSRIEFLAQCVRECAQIVVHCQRALGATAAAPTNGWQSARVAINKTKDLEEFVDDIYDTVIRLSHECSKKRQRRAASSPKAPDGALVVVPRRMSAGRSAKAHRTMLAVHSRGSKRRPHLKSRVSTSSHPFEAEVPLSDQVTNWHVRLATLEEQLAAARLKIKTYEETIAKFEQTHAQLSHELALADETEELANSQCVVLKSEFSALRNQFNVVTKRFADSTKHQTQLAQQLDKQQQEVTRLRLALQRKAELVMRHKMTNDELTHELHQARQRIGVLEANDKSCQSLQLRVTHQSQALEALRNQLAQLELAKSHLHENERKQREEVAVLHARIKSLRRENTKLRAQEKPPGNETTVAKPQDESMDPKQEAPAPKPCCVDLEGQCKQLKHRLFQKTQLVSSMKDQLAAKLEQLEDKTRQVTKLTHQIHALKDKVSQLESAIKQVTSDNDAASLQQQEHHQQAQEQIRKAEQARLDGLRASVYDSFEAFLECNQPPTPQDLAMASALTSPVSSSSQSLASSSASSSSSLLGLRTLQSDRMQQVARIADFSPQELDELMEKCQPSRKHPTGNNNNNNDSHQPLQQHDGEWKHKLKRLEMALEETPEDCRREICECLLYITTRRFHRAFVYTNADAFGVLDDRCFDGF